MSHSISLSVSLLNVLLNLFVIFLVAVGGEIAQYGIYKSTQLQLKRRGTAPFITELTSYPVYEGFRKNFNGRESFSHPPKNKTKRVVIAGCTTSSPVRIEPYSVTLTVSHSMNVWQTYVSKVTLGNASKPTPGFGDITSNGRTLSAFLVIPSPDASSHANVTILEYHSQAQLRKVLLDRKGNKSPADVDIRNEELMVSYKLWCTQFSHSGEMFARALQVYRSVQLEDPEYKMQNVCVDGNVYNTVPCMNASDAVRAAITLALMNEKSCEGETFEYTECGIYHWKFLAPLLILFGFVVIFAVSNGILVMMENADIDIPYSSSAWSALAPENKTGMDEEQVTGNGSKDDAHRGFYQLAELEDGRKEVRFIFTKPQKANDVSKKEIDENEL